MRTKLFYFFISSLLAGNLQLAQNITNTLGTSGTFKIKDGSTDYLTLTQSNGNISFFRNMELGGLTSSTSLRGVITKNGVRFLHNYGAYNLFLGINAGNFTMTGYANIALGEQSLSNITSGANNIAIGYYSLYTNNTGNNNIAIGSSNLGYNTTGSLNTAIGFLSLPFNTTGNWSTAVGYSSLYSNTTGYSNTAIGGEALYSNTTGYWNTGLGIHALYSNTIGYRNVAVGEDALRSNSGGTENSSFGYQSLYSSTTGSENSSFGAFSLYYTTGSYNSGFGYGALGNNTTGSGNTAIGLNAGYNITTGLNNICIGYYSVVPSATSNNQVRIGSTAITYAGIQVAWTVTSDLRLKSNVTNSNLGLNFINKLRPVSYFRTNDDKQKTEYGFIAQEVNEILKQEGTENTGMISVDDEGMYSLRYNDFIAPMVKAIQELKAENEMLKNEIGSLKEVKDRVAKLEELLKQGNPTEVKFTEK